MIVTPMKYHTLKILPQPSFKKGGGSLPLLKGGWEGFISPAKFPSLLKRGQGRFLLRKFPSLLKRGQGRFPRRNQEDNLPTPPLIRGGWEGFYYIGQLCPVSTYLPAT